MRILLISTADAGAGAFIAAQRLLLALHRAGADAQMLVLHRRSGLPQVAAPLARGRLGRWHAQAIRAADYLRLAPHLRRVRDIFQFTGAWQGWDIRRHPLVRQADVLHLHWVHEGFLSADGIGQLAHLGKPVFWTLHDMWALTGGCHYAGSCTHYTGQCGRCPYLRGNHPDDASHRIWQRKRRAWAKARLHLVACSRWLADCARQATLTQGLPVQAIPNPIDTRQFAPGDRAAARAALGLPPHAQVLLFGASRIRDPRKGFVQLLAALAELRRMWPEALPLPELALFGTLDPEVRLPEGFTTHHLGHLGGERLLQAYRAADAFVIPSLEDNLPNTVMEAMACGTPVAAFAAGGIPDMVRHQETGWLAPVGDAARLAEGIRWLLETPARTQEIGAACRQLVLAEFAEAVVAERYLAAYRQALAG